MELDKKICDERIAHMHGVAEYMYRHAKDYGLDPDEMYVLGLLHDVGYMNGKDGHEIYGGNLIESLGMVRFGQFVACHGKTPEEYQDNAGLIFSDDIPAELILLWEADMKVGESGEEIGFSARLGEIARKYGIDSQVYRICEDTIRWLKTHTED